MPLVPINFAVPDSTTLKVLFNKNLSEGISTSNIEVEALEGGISNLKVKSVSIEKNLLVIKTNPQQSGGFYLLKLSNENGLFKSDKGIALSSSKSRKELYFTGYKKFNPVRERMINKVPNTYSKGGSNISRIIDVHSEEIYEAQRSAGQLLNDNYIRVSAEDEIRSRTSSAKDFLANENCFKLKRVSKTPKNFNSEKAIISLSDSSYRKIENNQIISLQETYSKDTVFIKDSASVKGGIVLSLPNKNIIKVLSVKFFREVPNLDCDGQKIFESYPLKSIRYGISDDFYDKDYSYKRFDIESNELFLNNFDYIVLESDYVEVEYLFKDLSISPDLNSLQVSYVKSKNFEAIPLNSPNVDLSNQNICLSDGSKPLKNGLAFFKDFSNLDEKYFTSEIKTGSSIPPKYTGEFKVNYEEGTVSLFGDSGNGIEEDIILCSYNHLNILEENLDYYINDNFDLHINYYSMNEAKNINIEFLYSNVFIEGVHYKDCTNIESIDEPVGSNFVSFFKLKTKHHPISQIFRIINKTTGEIYDPIYTFNNEVSFSGSKSPEFKNEEKESISFLRSNSEKITILNSILNSINSNSISRFSENQVYFDSVISESTFDSNTQYFVSAKNRESTASIESFITLNGEVIGANLSEYRQFSREDVTIGFYISEIKLKNKNLLNKENGSGNFLNSSLSLETSLFLNEVNNYKEQNILKFGDYRVDYSEGTIFAAINETSPGSCSYRYASFKTRYPRVFSIDDLFFEKISFESKTSKDDEEVITIQNLPESLEVYSGDQVYDKLNGIHGESLIVRSDKTIITRESYSGINFLGKNQEFDSPSTNYYDKSKHSYSENIIDLKAYSKSKASFESEGYSFSTKTSASKIFKITSDSDSKVLYSEGSIKKFSFVPKKITYDSGVYKVYLSSDQISEISTSDSVIFGDRTYEISAVNPISNYFSLESADSISGPGTILFEVEEIVNSDGTRKIVIPFELSDYLNSDSLYEISYFENDGLSVGEKVFVDFQTSNIYIAYTYIKDEVYISYQYGDNSIDWSISDSLLDGDTYYVDYEYGALRSQLRKNFGVLTEIPFFNNFEINVDREFYRDALEGTLQSFANGPIVDSYDNLIQNVVDAKPEINESFYNGWVLGSDNLSSNRIEYSDKLNYKTCRYKEGLEFDKSGFVSFSSDNKLPLSEGSVSLWTENFWSGIKNDSDIHFDFYNVGKELYNYRKDFFPYPMDKSRVFIEEKYFSILNFSEAGRGGVLSSKKLKYFNCGATAKLSFEFSLSDTYDYNFGESPLTTFAINDENRVVAFDFKLDYLRDSGAPISFVSSSKVYEDAPSISNKIPTVECTCRYPNAQAIFGFIDSTIEIYFDSVINISDSISQSYFNDDFVFYLQDGTGSIFKVLKFIDSLGNKIGTSWSGDVKGVILDRKPTYSTKSLTENFVSKDFLIPKDGFKIFFGVVTADYSNFMSRTLLGRESGIAIDLFSKTKISLKLDAVNNSVSLKGPESEVSYYYSEFLKTSDFLSSKSLPYYLKRVISDSSSLNFFIENASQNIKSNIYNLKYEIDYLFDKNDIYIGLESKNPKSSRFELYGDSEDTYGIPSKLTDAKKGIFIYKESDKTKEYFSPCDNFWSVLIKPVESIEVPSKVTSFGETLYESVSISQSVKGHIESENSFYRATYSRNLDVESAEDKEISLEYSSGNLLDDGWSAKDKSFSDDINIAIDGVSINSYDWFSSEEVEEESGAFALNENKSYAVSNETISFEDVSEFSIVSNVGISKEGCQITIPGYENSKYSGIKPLDIEIGSAHFSLEYIFHKDSEYIMINNEVLGSSLSIFEEKWNNKEVSLKLEVDKESGYLYIYVNEKLKYSGSYNFEQKVSRAKVSVLMRTKSYYSGSYNFEIRNLKYKSQSFGIKENSPDYLNIMDDKIEFEFIGDILVDGYGYQEEFNKLLFVSERRKYLLDSHSENSSISIYKDGHGFINFEILDKDKSYKISHSVKNFEENMISHIAASWAINETDNKVSLFLNGREVPNVYLLGTDIPIFSYEKFGDVSKEKIQDNYFSKIKYYEEIEVNTLAGSNQATSSSITSDDIGRSVDIVSTDIYDDLIGSYLFISDVQSGTVYFKNGITNEDFIFSGSSSVTLKFPPTIGLETELVTRVDNDKFKVFLNDSKITLKSESPTNFSAIVVNDKFIEFYGINENCKYSTSIQKDDEIHIKNFGLNSYFINSKVSISESTEDITFLSKYNFIMSKITTGLPAPMNLKTVDIFKVFEENLVPDSTLSISGNDIIADVDHVFVGKMHEYKSHDYLEDAEGSVLELDFFSSNIDFSSGGFVLTIEGNEGSVSEDILIIKNKVYYTTNKFTSLDRITFSSKIIDIEEEVAALSIKEATSCTSSSLNVFRYSEGNFIIGKKEDEYSSYDLSTGDYKFKYTTKLDISSERFGDKVFVGNSHRKNQGWDGTIEEFKVYNLFKDEAEVYKEFSSSKPLCSDKNTMTLIPFNDPFELQQEKLRKEVFLGSDNFKFNLESSEVFEAMAFINSREDFVKKMVSFGISRDIAEQTYFRCHKANGGPIFDISNFNPDLNNSGNRTGPNDNFSGSLLLKESGLDIDTSKKILDEKEFSVSTWISPLFDSHFNKSDRYIFSASNSKEVILKESSGKLILPEKAGSIYRIEAVTKKGSEYLVDSKIYEKYNIYGATGSSRDFSKSASLLSDKRTIVMKDLLPNRNSYYKVYFSPEKEKLQSVSLHIDKESELILTVKSEMKELTISKEVDFEYLKWSKILLTYKNGEFKVFLNGDKIIYHKSKDIRFASYFGNIKFLSDQFNERLFTGKISSTKISRKANGTAILRFAEKDINYYDKYSDNRELVNDEYTAYLNNFDFSLTNKDSYSEIIDKKSGIFDFEVDIMDPFDKLDKDYKKDLVEYLIKRIKPAHSNAIVRIKKDRC